MSHLCICHSAQLHRQHACGLQALRSRQLRYPDGHILLRQQIRLERRSGCRKTTLCFKYSYVMPWRCAQEPRVHTGRLDWPAGLLDGSTIKWRGKTTKVLFTTRPLPRQNPSRVMGTTLSFANAKGLAGPSEAAVCSLSWNTLRLFGTVGASAALPATTREARKSAGCDIASDSDTRAENGDKLPLSSGIVH